MTADFLARSDFKGSEQIVCRTRSRTNGVRMGCTQAAACPVLRIDLKNERLPFQMTVAASAR